MRGTFFIVNTDESGLSGLDKRIDKLSSADRALFKRLYALRIHTGKMIIPEHLRPWVERQFGSVEAVSNQQVVQVANLVTGDETVFNSVRSLKPSDTRENSPVSLDRIDMGADTFASPLTNTPEDTFGRVEGRHCITASNIAKCDELHGVVIFKNSHPLKWGQDEVTDYIGTAWKWALKAHSAHPLNRYFFFCWNCLWRSGASINHGHAQMTLSRGRAFSRIETLRRSALSYRQKYGTNYFDDLYRIHNSLGLAFEKNGVRIMASLTPVKSREVMLLAESPGTNFKKSVYDVLSVYRDRMGVTSFNFAFAAPPLDRTRETWHGFPVVAWLVDRGSLHYRSSDIGSMELFAANTVAVDPFKLAAVLKENLGGESKNA